MKEIREKLSFVFLVECILILIFLLVGLLKITGRFKEKELKPFPKNEKRMVLVMNHPDGNEWIFIYRRFFKPLYLLMPWLIIRELPYTLADRINFNNPFVQILNLAIILIDRENPGSPSMIHSRAYSLKQCVKVLNSEIPLIGFFEGTRTRKAKNKLYSKMKKKPLGKLNESLGFIVKQNKASLEAGWIEYPGLSFSSLPDNGQFNFLRFCVWYWKTLRGQNGTISLIWGELKRFENSGRERKEITKVAEDYLLELADMV